MNEPLPLQQIGKYSVERHLGSGATSEVYLCHDTFAKRNVAVKNFEYGPIIPATHSSVRQEVKIQQGIPMESAKKIVALIKDSKKKAQASINGDLVRIASKDRDTLQEVIALLKGKEFDVEIQFTNFRSN